MRFGRDWLYADSVDRYVAAWAWAHGWRERRERRLMTREVRPGMVAVDVGANLGFHTLTLAGCVGPSGRVHAVEPDPRNFGLLSRAVRKASLSQVRLHQVAAAERPGPATLYLAATNRGDHRLVPAREPRQQVTVTAVTLDQLLSEEDHVDFVKIDVQGAEVSVLRGLRNTLQRNSGLRILCELSPGLLRRAGADAETFFTPLREVGLRPHRVGRDGSSEAITEAAAWAMAESAGYDMIYVAPA